MNAKRNGNILLVALCTLCVLSLTLMLTMVFLRGGQKDDRAVSFTPPPFDPAAVSGFPDVPENLGFSPLQIEQGFTVYVCGSLTAAEGKVPVYFTSPDTNTVLLRLQLLDGQNKILAESGLIRPGEYLSSLTLSETPDSSIPVTLKMIAYRPETYHSMGTAGLNTTLQIRQQRENGKDE